MRVAGWLLLWCLLPLAAARAGITQMATDIADSTALATTATETAFSTGSYTFPANTLRPGVSVRVRAWGRFSTTLTPTMQWNLRWGSVNTNPIIVGTSAVTDPVSGAVSEQWSFEAVFTCRSTGASGAVDGTGSVFLPTTSARVDAVHAPDIVSGTTTVDTTASTALTLFFKWGTSSASNTITLGGFVVEVLDWYSACGWRDSSSRTWPTRSGSSPAAPTSSSR